jgi:hypothetical protein
MAADLPRRWVAARATSGTTACRNGALVHPGSSLAYTVAMLLRAVRQVVVGAAVLLALHLFMLIGHGQAGHGPWRRLAR